MSVENPVADVYKSGVLAAHLGREPDGVTAFGYTSDYLNTAASRPVATTLPLVQRLRITQAGAVPPFFAGLLPEGRRLTNLRRSIKASADDEVSLLLAVGADTIGDVQIVPHGEGLTEPKSSVEVEQSFEELSFDDLLAGAGIIDPVSIAGVQEKVSARMLSLPVRRQHERFILKLSPPEFPHVVENEAFFLKLAAASRLSTASAEIVHDRDGRSGLLVTRFDRVRRDNRTLSLAMEDSCQVLDKWPADKYSVTMEEAALAVIGLCDARPVAAQNVFRQVVFAWLTGNGDLHAKNLSVRQEPDGEWRISPAYDLPSTVPYGDLTLALSVNDELSNLTRHDLLDFARTIGVPERAARSVLNQQLEATSDLEGRAHAAKLPFDTEIFQALFAQLSTRRSVLVK